MTYLFIYDESYVEIEAKSFKEAVRNFLEYCGDLSGAAELALKGAETEEDFYVILGHFPTVYVEKVYQVGRPLYDNEEVEVYLEKSITLSEGKFESEIEVK